MKVVSQLPKTLSVANFRAYLARLHVFFDESGYFPPIVRSFLFYTDVPCTVIIVTVTVTSCGLCINLTFQNSVLTPHTDGVLTNRTTACTLSMNLIPNCMSIMESFQSSNRTVPDSILSSIGEPEPISKNAPDCV
ncbi:hypothetical protein M9H77_07835 [Catharanthus roseus]|uniref:Uncharacterized protein n=1 Tax=Catharanthus roseus TaxID=4058 RepID=A0ACC0BW36_CATRO|nr:hypothetical protein M9H77_07835 [Catharanthus roseus]